jgi:hypothetical protein
MAGGPRGMPLGEQAHQGKADHLGLTPDEVFDIRGQLMKTPSEGRCFGHSRSRLLLLHGAHRLTRRTAIP